ncbi:MAG: FAD-linked oxidase C-terminal domain-containing protein [Anaerolineales bacterium]
MSGDPAALLVVEFSGDEFRDLLAKVGGLDTVSAVASTYSTTSGRKIFIAESKEEQRVDLECAQDGAGLAGSQPRSARPIAFIDDCAIPVERLGEFVREVEKILSAHGTEGGIYAHASAGRAAHSTCPRFEDDARRGESPLDQRGGSLR